MQTTDLKKFCSSCGSEVNPKASICVNCGVKQVVGWSQGTKTFLFLMALFMPIVGGIAGIVGLFNDANRSYSIGLLFISFFAWLAWTFVFMGMMVI